MARVILAHEAGAVTVDLLLDCLRDPGNVVRLNFGGSAIAVSFRDTANRTYGTPELPDVQINRVPYHGYLTLSEEKAYAYDPGSSYIRRSDNWQKDYPTESAWATIREQIVPEIIIWLHTPEAQTYILKGKLRAAKDAVTRAESAMRDAKDAYNKAQTTVGDMRQALANLRDYAANRGVRE